MRRTAWVLAAMLAAPAARADEPAHARATLDYDVPRELATCPDRDAFASAVATRLGYDPFAAAPAADATPRTLVVRYRRDRAPVIAVSLAIDGADKKIVSEKGACDELGAAAAFAAAILIDPRAMFPRPPAKPAASGGPSLDSSAPGTWPWWEPPPLPPEPPKPAPPPPPILLHAGIAGTGCAGCGPSPTAGGSVFVGLARARFGVDLGARADLPTTATAPSGRDVSSSLVVGELFPHARFGPARLGLLGSLGALFGDSKGEKLTSLWAAAGARVGVDWMLASPFFLRAALDGLVVIGRVSLRVDGGEVWSSPGFAAGLSLGAGLEF
jgi:hypothetical protein